MIRHLSDLSLGLELQPHCRLLINTCCTAADKGRGRGDRIPGPEGILDSPAADRGSEPTKLPALDHHSQAGSGLLAAAKWAYSIALLRRH